MHGTENVQARACQEFCLIPRDFMQDRDETSGIKTQVWIAVPAGLALPLRSHRRYQSVMCVLRRASAGVSAPVRIKDADSAARASCDRAFAGMRDGASPE
jgi:hypothetical protein